MLPSGSWWDRHGFDPCWRRKGEYRMGGNAEGKAAEIAREYLAIWNDRAYDRIPALVHPAFVMDDPFAPARISGVRGQIRGQEALETFIDGVVTGFPDFSVDVEAIAEREDRVLYYGTLSLTHEGSYFGMPPTGQTAEVRYMGTVTLADGRVRTHEVFPPVLALAQQLRPRGVGILGYTPRFLLAGAQYLARSLRSSITRD